MNGMEASDGPAWMTRREAAEHLRFSLTTVHRLLVAWSELPIEGRLRFRIVTTGRSRTVRILRRDVLAMLPAAEATPAPL